MFDSLAHHLLDSAQRTHEFSVDFKSSYDMPPTAMAQIHHMRAVLQARLTHDDNFDLSPRRAEFGRIEVADTESGTRYLLKSASAFAIEQQTEVSGQIALFPPLGPRQSADLHVVIFDLGRTDLTFFSAPAVEVGHNRKVRVIGQPDPAGRWPLAGLGGEGFAPFDQDVRDQFDDLGRESDEGDLAQ